MSGAPRAVRVSPLPSAEPPAAASRRQGARAPAPARPARGGLGAPRPALARGTRPPLRQRLRGAAGPERRLVPPVRPVPSRPLSARPGAAAAASSPAPPAAALGGGSGGARSLPACTMAAERGGCSLEAVPLPAEVRESLAELELELSEGERGGGCGGAGAVGAAAAGSPRVASAGRPGGAWAR